LNKNLSSEQIYCGNNFAKVKPEQIVGNPLSCYQKGIIVGKNQPLQYKGEYIPIDKKKINCQENSRTSLNSCLQKGFIEGQRLKAKN
jgi:hypothetical protein